jgi:hypothetical protein
VTDRTCEQILGVAWRPLRIFCRQHRIVIGHIGRRPVVRVADVLAALDGEVSREPYDEARVIEAAAKRRPR